MAKILFIRKLWYESLGIMQLSAVIKSKGHSPFLYMDNGSPHRLLRFARKIKPDLVGFSIMTGQHLRALKTATILKNRLEKINPLIIFGGLHPTFVPEIIEKDPVDIICRGEGEGAISDLMNAIDRENDFSNISNLWVKRDGRIIKNELRPLIRDLDSLPFPDRNLFYQYSYFCTNPNKMVMASRGCPFNCSFCFNEKYRQLYKIETAKIRRRSCKNVIDEIKLLKAKYKKTKVIRFHDDIFTLDKEWLYNFLEIYKKEANLPFMCYIKAGLDSEETIKKLSEAGCVGVSFGVETGNEALRYRILNKKVSNKQIYETSHLLKKYKIPFYVNNIFFIPGTTTDDMWETVKINQKIKPNYLAANIFQPYPGTSLCEKLLKSSVIKTDYLDNIKDIYSFSAVKSENVNIRKNIFYFFYLLVKFPWLTQLMRLRVKCKPNILFLLIFKVTAGIDYWRRNKLGFMRFLREAFHHCNFKG